MKNILIVSSSFYPENTPRSFRTSELAKELIRQGNKVKVITHFHESTINFCNQNGIVFKDLGKLYWKIPTQKANKFLNLFQRIIFRLALMILDYPNIQLIPLIKRALKDEKNYDLLISIAVPHSTHWGVAYSMIFNNKIAKTWIADCGDPYMGQENDSFKPLFYFKWVEMWFCKKANFISVPTPDSVKAYYPEFVDKIKIIPQGFKFEDIEVLSSDHNSKTIKFGYGGVFIPGRRDPTEFLTYLTTLKDLDYECYVYTSTPQLVEKFIEESKGKIKLFSPVPRIDLLKQLSKLDFVLNFENLGTAQTPSKLIDYAIIKKPILSIKTGNLNKITVNEFLNKNYSNQLIIDNPEQYRIENVARKFIDISNL